ncbi:MAG: CHRD domain-containing protein [Polyangiales bacterium]
MRYLFGFMCVLALGVMGCSETAGTGGSGGDGGQGGTAGVGGVGGDAGGGGANGGTSTVIGNAGGTATSSDGRVVITIPAGALSDDTLISIVPNSTSGSLGTPYAFGPEGITFNEPVTVTVSYTDADIPDGASDESILIAKQYNGYFWRGVTNSIVDSNAKTVSALVTGFSTYGLTIGPYSAQLDGAQQVPASTSNATGNGRFLIDTVHNLLAYDISYQNLEGSETAVSVRGPAERGVDSAIVQHNLPTGNPKLGQWQYDESVEADILAGRMYVNISSDQFVSGEIRGQIEPDTSLASDASVIVSVNTWDISSGMTSTGQTPADVSKLVLEIESPGLSTISRNAVILNSIEEAFSLAKGIARRIKAEAFDSSDRLIYQSTYYADMLSDQQNIKLTMRAVGDTVPPVFSGAVGTNKVSGESASLRWNAATDNITADSDIQYLIYLASSAGAQDYSWPTLVTKPGEIQPTLAGLSAGKDYYVVVNAMDQSGNIDTNNVEVVASTYANGSGLYVDEKSGSDTNTCGRIVGPCKTISQAISLSSGNEPIYVARGDYDAAIGENFPLQLKAGHRLICEEPDLYFMPASGSGYGLAFLSAVVVRSFPVVNISGHFSETLVSGADNSQLRNCKVNHLMDGNLAGVDPNNPPYAIEDNGSAMLVDGVYATGFGGLFYAWDGVKFTGDGSQLHNSRISGFSMNGLLVQSNDTAIGDNHFTNNLNGVVNQGNGTSVSKNRFTSTPDFIYSQGITYGTQGMSSAGRFASDVGPSDVVIANNDFRGLYGAGIEVGESTNTTIAGNTLENNGAGIEVTHVYHNPSSTLVYRNRVVGNQIGLAIGGGKADADIVANTLMQNSLVDLSIDTDVVVNASKCNGFDNLPPVVGVVGDTGCPVGGDICYTVGTPEPVIPSGLCAIIAIP